MTKLAVILSFTGVGWVALWYGALIAEQTGIKF